MNSRKTDNSMRWTKFQCKIARTWMKQFTWFQRDSLRIELEFAGKTQFFEIRSQIFVIFIFVLQGSFFDWIWWAWTTFDSHRRIKNENYQNLSFSGTLHPFLEMLSNFGLPPSFHFLAILHRNSGWESCVIHDDHIERHFVRFARPNFAFPIKVLRPSSIFGESFPAQCFPVRVYK